MFSAATHVVVDQLPDQGTSVLGYVPVAAALIAALSAFMSWRAVRQANRIWKRSLLPTLVPSLTRDGSKYELRVGNASKSLAASAGWVVVSNGRMKEGALGDRFVAPDATVEVSSPIDFRTGIDDAPDVAGAVAIVWCRDYRRDLRVWRTDAAEAVLDDDAVGTMVPLDLVRKLLPDLPAELEELARPADRFGRL